jgi:uncharacterized protein (DUF1810 family)
MFYNEIINCEFSYKCPTDWDKLAKTNHINVKYCSECDNSVTLCRNQKEVDIASEKGICIAHPIYPPDFEKNIRDFEAGIGDNPLTDAGITMGLPARSYIEPYSFTDYETDEFDHFLLAQNETYDIVLEELKIGEKKTHWIWFIFPQISGLGHSPSSKKFSLASKDQALRYWNQKVLCNRLRECLELLLESKLPVIQILGELDAVKLKS